MKYFILGMLFTMSASACLKPKVAFPMMYFACHQDSDCVVYGEACRSCSYVWSVNKNKLAALTKLDNQWRVKDKCQRTCEACDTSKIQTFCKNEVCQIRP